MLRKTYRLRLTLLYCVPFLFGLGLLPRLYKLQVVDRSYYEREANSQHYGSIHLVPSRGKIYDGNGHELAGSVFLMAAYIEAKSIPLSAEKAVSNLAHDLARELNVEYEAILKKLRAGRGRPLLARELNEEQIFHLREILLRYRKDGISRDTITFEQEGKRYYSRGHVAPHVVGYTHRNETGDNLGAAGIEMQYDSELRGKAEEFRARRNATRHSMEPIDDDVLASTFGNSVVLTIDETIQTAAQAALAKAVEEHQAARATAVVYAVKTGEVLAMANVPSFDLNTRGSAKEFVKKNLAVTDSIEPGSVMKIITFLSLFEDARIIQPETTIDCEGGTWQMANGRIIRDSKRLGVVPIADVFAYSSNIGTIKAAKDLERQKFYRHLLALNFGRRTGIDLPGEVPGKLRPVERWDGYSMSSIPMGYELRATAIQMAAAIGAIANNGIYMQPHVVREVLDYNGKVIRRNGPTKVRRIASPVACHKVLQLMENVVTKGTGKSAALPNYRVGGKTGTTKKIDPTTRPPSYSMKSYIASFCGVAPIENPEICIYIYVDDPKGEKTYGGQVSAPIFKEIAEVALKVLRVPVSPEAHQPTTMEVTLDKIRSKMEGRLPRELLERSFDRDEISSGSMPDLTGMTIKEVAEKLGDLEIEYEFTGSGIVIDQSPKPLVSLEPGETARVTFGSEDKLIRTALAQVGAFDEDANEQTSPTPDTAPELILQRNGEAVALPLQTPGPGFRDRKKAPVIASREILPDLDEHAQGIPDAAAARKQWGEWVKEQERLAKSGGKKPAVEKQPLEPEEDAADHEDPQVQPNFDDSDVPAENDDPRELSRATNEGRQGRGTSLYDMSSQ